MIQPENFSIRFLTTSLSRQVVPSKPISSASLAAVLCHQNILPMPLFRQTTIGMTNNNPRRRLSSSLTTSTTAAKNNLAAVFHRVDRTHTLEGKEDQTG